jgi:putative membrane-bound dehydrogenase-like protein
MRNVLSYRSALFRWSFGIATLCSSAFAADVQPRPMSPEESVKAMTLPPGFVASIFAAEPDVRQPIGFCFDDRGRVWVAENYSYPKWEEGKDRIIILEDTDGDGRHDRRTLFAEGLTCVTGIGYGFGGVWVIAPPALLFIPDKDKDDKPDGAPLVLLDGFGRQGVHNIANGGVWGPDGWLYAGHGGTSYSEVGKPGTKKEERIPFHGGIWRYHPTKHVFESVAEGTTNPWGIDFDEWGQGFFSNSVTPHLYHIIPGAHYERRRESALSRYAYERIPPVADHLHWIGKSWDQSRGGTSEQVAVGGGHAHCGLMVYLGGAFPREYHGQIFMVNIHGTRVNVDLPRHEGAGYVASHGKDFLTTTDRYFRGLHMKYGRDGEVYLSDWYDTGECHTIAPDVSNGRIYKIMYNGLRVQRREGTSRDVSDSSSDGLAALQFTIKEWHVRHARRILQERGPDEKVHAAMRRELASDREVTHRLRALWVLHVTSGLSEKLLLDLLRDREPWMRGWAARLLVEPREVSDGVLKGLERLAANEPSPVVRLHLASTAQRLPPAKRWTIVRHLSSHAADATDRNIPLMIWYAVEPLIEADPKRARELAAASKLPKLREFIVRRLLESGSNKQND